MEIWQVLVSTGGLAVPIVLAAMARDRSMMAMITTTRGDWERAIAAAKDDGRKMIDTASTTLHDRISRVRDEYVRRDDLEAHLRRFEKQFDAIHSELVRSYEHTDKRFDELRKLLQGK